MKLWKSARRSKKQARPTTGLKIRTPALERLESRRMLSTVPVFKTYLEADAGGDYPGQDDFLQVASATTLNTAPMQRTLATGTLPGADAGDVFKVALEAGQLVTLGVLAQGVVASPMRLVLADSTGATVAKNMGVSVDPESGAAANGLALTYRATATGVYYVGVFNQFPDTTPAGRTYALSVRPIGISAATPDNAALNFKDGGMYVQLRAGRLQIVGPTGYGFELTGKWTKTTTTEGGVARQTYTATGGVQLVTPLGNLSVPLPRGGAIIVTTKANGWDGAFGEMDKSRIVSGLTWLDSIIATFNKQIGLAANLPEGSTSIDVLQGQEVGLALGSTITTNVDINAPLNPAIPYLYFVASGGASASFGNVSVAAAQSRLSFIVDPADPSLYIGVNLPAGPVPALSVGGSLKGLIPFKPAVVPSNYDPATMTFRGHVFALGDVNVPTVIVPGLSINLGGTVVLNLDANGDGGLLTYLRDGAPTSISTAFAQKDLGPLLTGLTNALIVNFGFAVNGKAGITLEAFGVLTATFTLAKGTYIATGTAAPKVFFRGEFTDNLLTGTFLAPYMKFVRPVQTIVLDGVAMPGQLTAFYEGKYEYFGFEATSKTTIVGTNLNVPGSAMVMTTVEASVSLLGVANAMFTGKINPDGTFELNGKADVKIAGFTLSQADLTVTKDAIKVKGTLNLGVLGSAMMTGTITAAGNFELTGSMMTRFGLGNLAPMVNADLTLSNANGLQATTKMTFLGQMATLTGKIETNLDFSLSGDIAVGFSTFIQDFTANVTVTLATMNGTPKLGGKFSNSLSGLGVTITVSGDLMLVYDGFPPTYMGSGSASGSGPFGAAIDVSGTISNGSLVFNLPYGLATISLPLPF